MGYAVRKISEKEMKERFSVKYIYILESLRLGRNISNVFGGLKGLPEYTTWLHIRSRCCNQNNQDYKYYGGRGIKVCEEWMHSFYTFLIDVGMKPSAKHSIDRIDVDGNYCKGNVRWATLDVQKQNIRAINETGYKGVSKKKYRGKWCGSYQVVYAKKYLGFTHDAIEAAEIYDRYAYYKLGDMAKLNFPENKEKYKKGAAREAR